MKKSNIKIQNNKSKFKNYRSSAGIYKHEHELQFEINIFSSRIYDPLTRLATYWFTNIYDSQGGNIFGFYYVILMVTF